MGRFLLLALALCACSDKKKNEGLPPAQEWGADPGSPPAAPQGAPANPHAGADPNNPHAGMNMGGGGADDPHAGVDMNNPHAGVDMNNPHAGVDMNGGGGAPGAGGTDVSKMNLPSPDPNRAMDPTHHVKGVIKIHPKAKDRVKTGTAVFVIVKQDVGGKASGPPLAVEKLTWDKDQIPFELTEAQAMIAGTQLTGDVVITAHYDNDGDALSKTTGDVIGEAHVKVPADNVTLTLDQVLP
jgi:hypothetical protein